MKRSAIRVALICQLLLVSGMLHAQRFDTPGHSIGKVSTDGNLIVVELDKDAFGTKNFFDLGGKTVRFTPDGTHYRIETQALQWDSDFGQEIKNPEFALHQFEFPFSGKSWNSFIVGPTGAISFGASAAPPSPEPNSFFRRPAGISVSRFAQLGDAATTMMNTMPAICAFFKPRMSGPRYVKELADRVIVTWDLTEPWGNIQDFTWDKTINRFQAVLHKDGEIDLSYQQLNAKDAIVGLFPLVSNGPEKTLAILKGPAHPAMTAQPALRSVKLSVVDNLFLKVTFETSGPVPPEGDPKVSGASYRVVFGGSGTDAAAPSGNKEIAWMIRGFAPRGGGEGGNGGPRYFAFGPGMMRKVEVSGDTISVQGTLPSELRGAKQVSVRAEVGAAGAAAEKPAEIGPQTVRLIGIGDPEVDLSSLTRRDGPFSIVYEAFHYYPLPDSRDLACTVIQALGDKFDFLAYYSDFRVDNQEAGTPSNGPRGGKVTGIGSTERGLESYCSKGRFQWAFIQPVYVGSNQMQEYPPADAPIGNDHDVTFYTQQLSERAGEKMMPYNYAMSQIGHELGHRWGADDKAKVGDETIELGPVHWDMGLQAPAAFPYQRPTEASAMGGGVWQDNFDGTFTQLDDNYYVPATGYSYLDLYSMGLISAAEVPDFFILRDLQPAGRDANGHRIFKAKRTKVTIQDVIAVEGPRMPDVQHSQKEFNTGIVVFVEHGQKPSPELIERANGIREQWMKYWPIVTGQRSTMTTNP